MQDQYIKYIQEYKATDPVLLQKLSDLRKQMNELLQWMSANKYQQISHPIGVDTQGIVKKDNLFVTGIMESPPIFDISLEINFNDSARGFFWLSAKSN